MSTKNFQQSLNLFFVFALMVGLLVPASSTSALTQNAIPAVNDTLYGSQWNLNGANGINIEEAWDITHGTGTVVAVLDTGISPHGDLNDLDGILLNEGYDFVSDPANHDGDGRDADAKDPGDYGGVCGVNTWQGMHVAGIIGAASNNGAGIAGINWNAKILPVRVIGTCGSTTATDIVDGMKWAAGLAVSGAPTNAKPAKVIHVSASVAGQVCDGTTPYPAAITAILGTGAVIVAAAGDNNANAVNFPANCAGVITVAATDKNGMRASYSNSGTAVEISAPGGVDGTDGILSTTNTGETQFEQENGDTYKLKYGTAMAAAHVSGVVSLMFAVDPTITPAKVLEILQATATVFPAGDGACTTLTCGSGIVNAVKALEGVQFTLLPDLQITNVALPNEYPAFGEQFQIDVTVKNMGRTGTPSPVYVQVYVDNPPVMGTNGCPVVDSEHFGTDTLVASPLGNGEEDVISVKINDPNAPGTPKINQWTANAPVVWGSGTHKLYVYVDGNCVVPEVDEGNNLYSVSDPPTINPFVEGALVYPRNSIGTDYNPTYKWNKVTGATWFRLYVSGPSGLVLDQWFESSLVCDDDNTCSVSPGLTPTLGNGNYSWWVLPWIAPSGSGSWSAEGKFTTAMPAPAATTNLLPTGSLTTNYTPTFTWNKVESASWYRLLITGPNGTVLDKWYDAGICDDICTVEKPVTVGGGSHNWWVLTWNSAGSTWSAGANFTTTALTVPAAAVNLSPTGPITTNYTPTFTWDTVGGGVTWYRLLVTGPNGTVLDKWYDATICSGGTCTVTKPVTLGGGSHDWWVLAWNTAGSTWSTKANFTTTPPAAPAATGTLSPTGPITTDYTPAFTWDTVGAATWYRLLVTGPNGTVLDKWYDASVCSGGTCTVTKPVTVGGGSFNWWVLTWNSMGSTWSAGANFTTTPLTAPAATGHLAPIGPITTNYTPTFTWDTVGTATWYRLLVTGPNGTVLDKWYDPSICSGGTCTATKPVAVGGGSHDWWVLTWNSVGSTWSAGATFDTESPTKPAQVDLRATYDNEGQIESYANPEEGQRLLTNYNPTFTWKKADRATYYLVLVNGPSGTIVNQWFPSTVCGDVTCSVPSPVTLTGGSYTWWVQTWNAVGLGDWSQGNAFTADVQTIPQAATLFLNGLPNSNPKTKPTYVWSNVAQATWYHLYVKGPGGVVLDQWYQSKDVCAGTYCSVVSPTTLASGDHTWWVQTWNPKGYGPWRSVPFKVQSALSAATGLSLKAGEPANEPVYTWNEVDMATRYHLYVTGPDYTLDKWYDNYWSICTAGVCSVPSPTTLATGVYTWSLMPYNSTVGYGLWANGSFTVDP